MITEQQVLEIMPALRRWARRFAHGPDAEDLLQETLRRCLEYRSGCDGQNITGWAWMIMRNCHYDIHRRDRSADYEFDSAKTLDHAASAEDVVYVNQIIDRIFALKPLNRCIMTSFIDGCEYDEIGAEYGLKLGTVKSRISRIRERLAA